MSVLAVSLAYAYVGSLATDLREVIKGRTRLSPLTLALIGGVSAVLLKVAVALLTTYTRRQLRRWAHAFARNALPHFSLVVLSLLKVK